MLSSLISAYISDGNAGPSATTGPNHHWLQPGPKHHIDGLSLASFAASVVAAATWILTSRGPLTRH